MKYEIINSKSEYRNSKQIQNYNDQIPKPGAEKPKVYDLEERTYLFAKNVRAFVKQLLKTIANIEDGSQLVRASGSVGANYIEANEALSKKDFIMRIKICRKEAKESRFWLRLVEISTQNPNIEIRNPKQDELEKERQELIQEATELMNIFGSIIRKYE